MSDLDHLPAEQIATPICDLHEQYLPAFRLGPAISFVDTVVAKRLERERAVAITHLQSILADHDLGGYPLQHSLVELARAFITAVSK
jgi:hypothetical protein